MHRAPLAHALAGPGHSPGGAHAPLERGGRATFGVPLAEQMARDDVDVPPIVLKCCEAIEKYGLDQQGLYRINGTHLKVQKLKERLDRGMYPYQLFPLKILPLSLPCATMYGRAGACKNVRACGARVAAMQDPGHTRIDAAAVALPFTMRSPVTPLIHSTDLDSVNLDADEWASDISNVTSVLKTWFRELPDPLFTTAQHSDFMEAARKSTLPCTERRTRYVDADAHAAMLVRRERERAGAAHPAARARQRTAGPQLFNTEVPHGPPPQVRHAPSSPLSSRPYFPAADPRDPHTPARAIESRSARTRTR